MRCTDLLFPFVPGCLLHESNPTSTLKVWLQDGDFELDTASSASQTPVIRNATRSFEPTLAREVDRFLCAMGESFSELQPSHFASRSIGWALIRAYYASYFAAHAILRMTGRCVTQIDSQLSVAVMRTLLTTGGAPTWTIGRSQYLVKYDEAQQLLLFEDKHAAQGGSHQFVWKKFGELIAELIASSAPLGSAYQSEILILSRISDTLTSQQGFTDYSWLSTVRNSVNYSFSHSVWFPFDGMNSRISAKLIQQLRCDDSTDILSTNPSTQSDLEKFCEATSFIVSFANASANKIAQRSTTKPFISKSYGKLQRLINFPKQ